jgi:Ferredoxin-like domain in Api92-like protein
MPNWNENFVRVEAPFIEVIKYLVEDDEEKDTYRFNMHQLFPERFCDCDLTGEKTWDYDWANEHTGSKWFPTVSIEDQGEATELIYDTAWSPNNLTLQRLHEKTGWMIKNAYEESGMAYAGEFVCTDGVC